MGVKQQGFSQLSVAKVSSGKLNAFQDQFSTSSCGLIRLIGLVKGNSYELVISTFTVSLGIALWIQSGCKCNNFYRKHENYHLFLEILPSNYFNVPDCI